MAAANTDLLKKLARRLTGQIGSGGVADAVVTTVPLSSATNFPTDTAVVAVIDRVDTSGTTTASLEETIIGVISGSNLVNCTRGVEGTAQAHSAGAVVEVLVTAKGLNDLIDHLLTEHNQLGGHTNITACNITASGTVSGNAMAVTPNLTAANVTAAQVPTNTVAERTSASGVTIDGLLVKDGGFNLGSDAQGDIYYRGATALARLAPGTSGQFLKTQGASANPTWAASGSTDGWTDPSETWTYASANTITVPTGAASKYHKGDRLKLTQTTVKYFVVISVADTVLTVAINTDYVVADAAISANFYSHQINPLGYPDWFVYAPTINGPTGTVGAFAVDRTFYQFRVDGRTCHFNNAFRISNKGSWTGNVQVSLPVALGFANPSGYIPFAGVIAPASTAPYPGRGYPALGVGGIFTVLGFIATMATADVGWANVVNGDEVLITGSYLI